MSNPSPANQWVKGQSGNPGGRRTLLSTDEDEIAQVTALARKFSTAAIKALVQLFKKGKAETVRLQAAIAILDRGCGKPPQFTTSNAAEFKAVNELRDHELDAIIARGIADGKLKPLDAHPRIGTNGPLNGSDRTGAND